MNDHRRRYDLDWLRVLAFGLLILYHVGMYYVADWGWHIKSPRQSDGLQNLMLLTSPWRMSLLFFLSGAALYFASRKISPPTLLRLRFWRLFLPLVFAMAVIVPPQLYVEIIGSGDPGLDYATFYALYLDRTTTAYPEHQHGPLGLWTWNHLWFLAYLWLYTFIFIALKPALDHVANRFAHRELSLVAIVGLPVIALLAYRCLLLPHWEPNNALVGDWYNHARYLTALCLGYVLAGSSSLWLLLARRRWSLLAAATVTYAGLLLIFHQLIPATAWPGETAAFYLRQLWLAANAWLWLLAVLGLGHHYLNRPGRVLRYMNDAILPWYILHQTLTVVLAFALAKLALPVGVEAALLVAGTVGGCALGYELVRRTRLTRLCLV